MTENLVTALGPIISHELGHLASGRSGQLAASGLVGILSIAQRAAEREADEHAAAFIERRLKDLQKSSAGNEAMFAYRAQPLFWFIKLLREIALLESFRGLRGMDGRDVLLNIEHKGCADRESTYPIQAGDFWRSEQNELPILTPREWQEIRRRLLDRQMTSSHDYALKRAAQLIAPLGPRFSGASGTIQAHLAFFDALMNDDPGILERERWLAVGLKVSEFIEGFGTLLTFERAAGFAANRTHVAVLPEGGYVEVRGEQDVEYARMVMKRLYAGGEENHKSYMVNSMLMMLVIARATTKDENTLDEIMQRLLIADAHCRWNSKQVAFGNVGLRYHRLNDSDFFVLEVMHRNRLPDETVISADR